MWRRKRLCDKQNWKRYHWFEIGQFIEVGWIKLLTRNCGFQLWSILVEFVKLIWHFGDVYLVSLVLAFLKEGCACCEDCFSSVFFVDDVIGASGGEWSIAKLVFLNAPFLHHWPNDLLRIDLWKNKRFILLMLLLLLLLLLCVPVVVFCL